MKLITGAKLNLAQIKHVKAAFIYRLTTENGYPQRNPCKASVPAISDVQWIKEHAFWFNDDGTPSNRKNYAEPAYIAGT